ncbi:phosphotransferase enzyme family protein [Gemmobacter fulva]|uniref:phosphotransferase enzyme family protein n=1 Tax=Gemmobacter fulvus TaxID=2840474 RepID=UPI0021B127D3|nr:phosphotransferase [Gemmobacter fulvus]
MTGGDLLLRRLQARAVQAQARWGLSTPPVLLKYRENAVFRVQLADGRPAALRLHRPGYHSAAELASELHLMTALRATGLRVPRPILTAEGAATVTLAADVGQPALHADIVSWMEGTPLGQTGIPLGMTAAQLTSVFTALGRTMAQMHSALDRWQPPPGFARKAWDGEGLLGAAPLWGRFWDCAGLRAEEAARLQAIRALAATGLSRLGRLDYGLIHADLVRENVLLTGTTVEMIDFDDSGPGWRMFDIATALIKNRREPNYRRIEAALIAGYRTARALHAQDLQALPLFLLLRALSYIGWAAARLEESGTRDRMARFLCDAFDLADAYQRGL